MGLSCKKHFLKEKLKKESLLSRQAQREVKAFIKNTTRRVEIFNKTRRAWPLQPFRAHLSLLCFFGFHPGHCWWSG